MAKGKAPVAFNRAVSHIQEISGEFTIQDIAQILDISDGPVHKACAYLKEKGVLKARSNGKRGRGMIYSVLNTSIVIETAVEEVATTDPMAGPVTFQPVYIPVREQFEMIDHITGMVIDGTAPAFLLTGMAGIGKTWTVRNQLEEYGMKQNLDYKWISGKASSMGLYEVLQKNPTGMNVFDDCDDVLKDSGALNILKTALDLKQTKTISWPGQGTKRAKLEPEFEFSGQVIFISNLNFADLADALTSRTFKVDVQLTPEQVIEKIQLIIKEITPNGLSMSMEYKEDALEALISLKDDILALGKNLDIRAFEKACLLRQSAGDSGWGAVKEMIKYQI